MGQRGVVGVGKTTGATSAHQRGRCLFVSPCVVCKIVFPWLFCLQRVCRQRSGAASEGVRLWPTPAELRVLMLLGCRCGWSESGGMCGTRSMTRAARKRSSIERVGRQQRARPIHSRRRLASRLVLQGMRVILRNASCCSSVRRPRALTSGAERAEGGVVPGEADG